MNISKMLRKIERQLTAYNMKINMQGLQKGMLIVQIQIIEALKDVS
jgi:hypothetical protein